MKKHAPLFRLAALASLVLPAFLATPASAQTYAPLFESDEPLQFTLSLDLRTLVRRASRRPEVNAVLEYAGPDGRPVVLDAEVRTRGKSRLEICDFPPLSVNLRRSQVEGTLFANQNRLKLVTLCKRGSRYEQALHLERLAYQIYGLVSDRGYRSRRAAVTYVDTERDDDVTVAPAFFIEHTEGLAERLGLVEGELRSVPGEDLDPAAATDLALLQFLIANVDWSSVRPNQGDEECCHNIDLLVPAGRSAPVVPVPYDFDMSGLVDAEYAVANEQLRLRSVRQRRYRGFCEHNDHVEEAAARFVAARERINELIATSPLDEAHKEETSEFLNSGLDVLANDEARNEEIIGRCRSLPPTIEYAEDGSD